MGKGRSGGSGRGRGERAVVWRFCWGKDWWKGLGWEFGGRMFEIEMVGVVMLLVRIRWVNVGAVVELVVGR